MGDTVASASQFLGLGWYLFDICLLNNFVETIFVEILVLKCIDSV